MGTPEPVPPEVPCGWLSRVDILDCVCHFRSFQGLASRLEGGFRGRGPQGQVSEPALGGVLRAELWQGEPGKPLPCPLLRLGEGVAGGHM